MSHTNQYIKSLITLLGFKLEENAKGVFYKTYTNHNNYCIKVDFEKSIIEKLINESYNISECTRKSLVCQLNDSNMNANLNS